MTESRDMGEAPIWARPEPSPRSLRFSRQEIAEAALGIADAEGFDAVSMRRIARSLGAGTMSLYRYIATKDDLLALIGDALLGEALVPGGDLPGDWLEAIAAVARQTRHTYLRHPWAIRLVQREGALQAALAGPNGLRHVEQSLSALSGAPMDAKAKLDVLAIVDDYVFGHLMRAAGTESEAGPDAVGAHRPRGRARSASGHAPPEPGPPGNADFVRSQLSSGNFPQLAAVMSASGAASFTGLGDQNARFELGLGLLLDGIAEKYG